MRVAVPRRRDVETVHFHVRRVVDDHVELGRVQDGEPTGTIGVARSEGEVDAILMFLGDTWTECIYIYICISCVCAVSVNASAFSSYKSDFNTSTKITNLTV